ncbi:MAG: phosphatase PAP2 family protein [Terracidiphilus sp.]
MRNPRQPHPLRTRSVALAFLLALAFGCCAGAQTGNETAALPDAPQAQTEPAVTLRDTPRNILHDQVAIWTSPARIGVRDLEWLAPLAVATGAAIATDHRAMSQVVSHDSSFNNANTNASNIMIGGFIAAPVALYGFGHFQKSAHAREAGILSGEAMIDSVVVEQGMKLIFWRERPALDSARGRFFQSGVGIDSSFPSSHSVVAWSAAAAIASEYPSRWTQLFVYSAATGISLNRVLGQQHFPSDVLVGSAAGWLVGRYVARHHHRR